MVRLAGAGHIVSPRAQLVYSVIYNEDRVKHTEQNKYLNNLTSNKT